MKKRIPTEVIEHLLGVKSVGLLMHINPDWDCLGSCLALKDVLTRRGIVCDIYGDEPLPHHLSIFGADVAKAYKEGDLDKYECLCCVDVGESGRIGRRADAFARHEDTACIDHHIDKGGFARLSYVDEDAPAVGEVIFDMLKSAGIPLSKEAASYLYCAISADTGSFRYASTTAHTMNVVSQLMSLGIDAYYLGESMYEIKTLTQLKLQGEAISTLELHFDGKIATAYVSTEMYEKYNANKSDTEFLAALPRTIEGVAMSAFFTQRTPNEIRVNLRSKGDYNVCKAAAAFGGGGHIRASGCTIEGHDMAAAIKAVVAELGKQL